MTGRPRLFGAEYSVYVRIVRLALAEKGTDYELVPVDIFASDGPRQDYLERHPFGRIPAFEYEGFRLYETGAITRYVDDVFDGRRLQPLDPRERARCNQLRVSPTTTPIPLWSGESTWNGLKAGERRGR